MSVRVGRASMRDVLMTRSPPAATSGSNLARDGGIQGDDRVALSTIGEPIISGATITVHEAVPPRISGP